MSRLKHLAHSVLSGYALIGANVIYTLVSLRVALHYLSKEEFGLWATVLQLANFNMILVDLGMSGSLSRILIDHKDNKTSSSYGTIIQTGALVLIVQAALIALLGSIVSLWLPGWMHVQEKFWGIFRSLMIWQCAMAGVAFTGRIFTFILTAHQRYDVYNYANVGGLATNLLVLWVSFHWQLGLYSMLTAFVAGAFFNTAFCACAVCWLRLLPAKGCWGKPSRAAFRELFTFGADLFLLAIGQQLIALSPVPVISRALGLEAVAVWSIAIKIFVLAQQLVFRIFDFSVGALAEMIVRGEAERLKKRFGDLIILTGSAAAAGGMLLALCNHSFLQVWMHGSIAWSPVNDLLMAVSFFVYSLTRLPIGLVGQAKQVGNMKYIYFVESAAFVGLGLWLAPHFGIPGVILSGIVTDLLFSGVYGSHRTINYFKISYADLIRDWLGRPTLLLVASGIVAAGFWMVTRRFDAPLQLALNAGLAGILVFVLFWRLGLSTALRSEATQRLRRSRVGGLLLRTRGGV